MASTRRIERTAELILKEVSWIIAKDFKFSGAIVTLTRSEVSQDLQYADIYFMVVPDEQLERVLVDLLKNVFAIQQALNKRLRMRPVPKIRFHKDEAELEAVKLDEFLKGV